MSETPERRGTVYRADGVEVARGLADESVDLVYLDPPLQHGEAASTGAAADASGGGGRG